MAPSLTLPSLAVDLPLDDAIDILKRRQVHYQSAPLLPLATVHRGEEKEIQLTSPSWTREPSKSSSIISGRYPSRQKAFKVLKSKNLLASSARLLPVPTSREPVVSSSPEAVPQRMDKLPKLRARRRGSSVGPLPPNWRPSSRGQIVSRAAAAAFWGITLEDGGSDLGDDQEYSSQHFYKHKHKQQPQREAPLAALHAATSVPLADLKEACAIFERFAQVDSEDITNASMDMRDFESLLCHITGVQNVKELEQEFVKQAFYAADRDHTGDIDIFEFVTWYSAFSFSEAVCVNKFARETRDVARKHGMSILNIERYKKSFDRYDLNSNGVIEFDASRARDVYVAERRQGWQWLY